MASNVFLVGGTSDSGAYYFYALRRDDEGNLFIRRDDVANEANSIDVFGLNKPVEFDGNFIGVDYDAGRNSDHTLENTIEDVKYEQWYWDTKLASFYIDADGELVAAYGRENKWIANTDYVSYNEDATPTIFELSLYGRNQQVNLYEKLVFAGWNGVDPVEVTNEGLIHGITTESAGLTISGDYPYGITLINNGKIEGAPGYKASANITGEPGNAIDANVICTIINNADGIIQGGASATGGSDGYAIAGIDSVTLTNNGQIGSTI
jgi:hypothetical protein